MLRSPHKDKENLPSGVAAPVTPARHPLKSVANTGTPTRTKHSDLSKRLIKRKHKSKRLSAPVYNLTQLIPDVLWTLKHSPVLESVALAQLKSDSQKQTEKGKCETPHLKEKEIEVEGLVEEVVTKILKEVMKNETNLKQESSSQKMEEYKAIILQMNKERLRLERQLADLMKGQSRSKKIAGPSVMCTDLRTVAVEKDLDLKAKGLCEVQDILTELPVLRSDLLKSRHEARGLNEVLFSSRKENADLKDLVAELKEEIKEKDAHSKLQKNLNEVTKQHDHTWSEFQRVSKLVEQKDEQLERNKIQCQYLNGLINRLENVAAEADKDVSLSKENKTALQNQELQQELVQSRQRENNTKEHCNKLLTQIDTLVADTDIHKMEISRQQDVINRQQTQINDLKVELSASLEQMESMQSQQQEMNEFTEEERRNLELTVREMENQLKLTSLKTAELNASLKSKSQQCAKLIEEVKQSRSLLQDKQEELDATQSQAHWLVLQQEAMMSETADELNDISELVNDLLRKFTEEARLGERGEDASRPEVRRALIFSVGSNNKEPVLPTPVKSLVQSVLEARASKEHEIESNSTHNKYEADNTPVAKLSPIPETLENELDCSGICDDEQKPLSLTEQVLELKQALKQLVEIGSGQAASVEAQTTINRLEEERMLSEQQYESSLQKMWKELEDSKTREAKLRREVSKKSSDISALQLELMESTENLQHSFQKIESLGQQFEKTIDQQDRMKELSADVQRYSDDVKKLERDKECLSQHLMECLATLDELSPAQSNFNQTQSILGKVMGDKFNLEKKVQELKEKAINYRLETQDFMAEYKLRADSKIRILEGNLRKAETEICRLDALVEKIRLVLHHSVDVITSCPDLLKLLSFLDGEDIQ